MKNSKMYILGPRGTNGHQAATQAITRNIVPSDVQLFFVDSNAEVLLSVEDNVNVSGVSPIVNGSVGAIDEVIHFWLQQPDDRPCMNTITKANKKIWVIGEVLLPVKHCLLVKDKITDISHLTLVKSHPAALKQVKKFLAQHGLQSDSALSTAQAASWLAEQSSDCTVGAIASSFAATEYGLHCISEGIEDNPKNKTRFHVLGKYIPKATGDDKTAILFWVKRDMAGALDIALDPIRAARLNKYSIQTIQIEGEEPEEVAFYCEFAGHCSDVIVQSVLNLMANNTDKMVVLGSYPKTNGV